MTKRHRLFWIIISVITIAGMVFTLSPGILSGSF